MCTLFSSRKNKNYYRWNCAVCFPPNFSIWSNFRAFILWKFISQYIWYFFKVNIFIQENTNNKHRSLGSTFRTSDIQPVLSVNFQCDLLGETCSPMPFVFPAGEVLPSLFQWSWEEEKVKMTKRKYEKHTLVAAQSLEAKKISEDLTLL